MAATDCILSAIAFPRCRGRRVEADFGGGDISSTGGALMLAAADRRLGLLSGLARRLDDRRQAGKVDHKLLPLSRQRMYAVALGHEDVNDHDSLRDDPALQTALGRDERRTQLELFVGRTSCHRWWPNRFRLVLSPLANTLIEAIRLSLLKS